LHPSAAIVLIENVIRATWFVSKVSCGFSNQAAIFPDSEQKRLDTVLLCNWVSKRIGSNGVMKNVLGKMTTDTGCV
ncbi:hypothetical protein T02_12819, partial [Trichinella nativa]